MTTDNKPFAKNPNPTPSTSKSPDIFETLITWTFKVVTIPLRLVTIIVDQMLTPGAAGSSFLGKAVFVFLVILSSDSYWQILFQGSPLFPWYENNWTGWGWLPGITIFPFRLWLGLFTNPTFYLCVGIGLIIQSFQSAFVNGDKFGSINRKVIGFIAVATWIFDLIITFTSRSPFRYQDPYDVLGCILFNIFTIGCAEWGRWGEKILSKRS